MFSSSLILLSPAIRLLTVLMSVEDVMSDLKAMTMQKTISRLLVALAGLDPTPSWAKAQFMQVRYWYSAGSLWIPRSVTQFISSMWLVANQAHAMRWFRTISVAML